ncbi:hypothetical protein GQ457_07G006100 [Hibiscus cannabinus]
MAPFTTPSSIVFPNLETYTVRSPISHTLVFQTPPRIIVPHLFMIITSKRETMQRKPHRCWRIIFLMVRYIKHHNFAARVIDLLRLS